MVAKQTTAILLKRYRLSETSLILVWLTEEYGKVKTTARGALKAKSPFVGNLELFTTATISFSCSRKSDLYFLKEVAPLLVSGSMPSTYKTLLCASYFAELCDLLTELEEAVPEIYDLLDRAFLFLRQYPPTLRAVAHFEKSLAKTLGVYAPGVLPEEVLQSLTPRLPANRGILLKLLTLVQNTNQ